VLSNVRFDRDYRTLENGIKSMNPAEIKTLDGLQAALNTINKARSKVDSLQKAVSETRTHFTADLENFQNSLKRADDWIKEDYKNALAKAKLPDINRQNIGKFIFGSKIVYQLERILGITATVRKYAAKFQSDKPKKEKPPRLKGQNIHFVQKNAKPEFWARKIHLSGKTQEGLSFAGEVDNLVSSQRLIGKTTTFTIKGSRADGSALNVNGEFNYLDEVPQEAFSLKMKKIPLSNVKLADLYSWDFDLSCACWISSRRESTLSFAGSLIRLISSSEKCSFIKSTIGNLSNQQSKVLRQGELWFALRQYSKRI
ncbi:MAG: hypothetical protein GWP06_11125, partial [Actinobacteria bacterium]|nr:hypothetical protein [Actinomycetota bacterium]